MLFGLKSATFLCNKQHPRQKLFKFRWNYGRNLAPQAKLLQKLELVFKMNQNKLCMDIYNPAKFHDISSIFQDFMRGGDVLSPPLPENFK